MLWSGLATGDARLARQALGALPPTPARTTWVNYVRCHDDIGWAVDDADAGAVGLSGAAHRRYLADFFRGDFPGSDAIGAAFSVNADNGDERTCGTTAALCGLSAARATGDEVAIERAVRRLLLPHAVMSAFGGIPLLYMGDELGLDNDLSYLDDEELADDSRWMHRPWMPWDVADLRHEPGTVEHRIFDAIVGLFTVRRGTPALTAGGETWIHDLPDPAVLGWARRHAVHGRFYGLANLSDRAATVPRAALGWAALAAPREVLASALGSGDVVVDGDVVRLEPYSVAWFVDEADVAVQPPPATERVPLPPPRSERCP
jgi:amylosucrase